jgi:ribA/ribD-fused uncharacterized protein
MDPITSFTGRHSFLSNFHHSPILLAGDEYPTVEHAFQAQKTLNGARREQIRTAHSPALAKKIGRQVQIRANWDGMKERVMLECLRLKFAGWPALARALERTGDGWLEEGNTWGDRYWGTVDGTGHNRLGVLLMQVRTERRFVGGF